ncbi:hypothetical protein [Kineosporia succinea]|uniref:Uncharacterized protein n=1 Tax=Kineosporia succinea TaxID=84632 RepID=A0ABT9NWE2_9ACTN|nr:hypothetical protein [Kineosporia succinea]MDP9824741.1 hypothetical protein [Kineosporia succinea]
MHVLFWKPLDGLSMTPDLKKKVGSGADRPDRADVAPPGDA